MMLQQLGDVCESTRKLEGMVREVTTSAEGIGPSILQFITCKLDLRDRDQEKIHWQKNLMAAIYESSENWSEKYASTPSIPNG